MRFLLLSLLLVLSWTAHGQKRTYSDAQFNRKLYLARELLTRPTTAKFISEILWDDLKVVDDIDITAYKLPRGKTISETQMLILLDQNEEFLADVEAYIKQVPRGASEENEAINQKREKWRNKFEEVLSDEKVRAKFREVNNPLEPYVVTELQGYSSAETFVNHPREVDGKLVPAEDLKKIWIREIRSAKKEIALNVFDFDLEDVADELIAAQKRGVSVKVGIDASVIEAKPEVAAVYKKLKKNKVFVHAVDSVGLNHQKMMAIDWSVEKGGRVLFSSGNLTQSCLGAEGDLKHIPKATRPKVSIPNANHVITMKSDVISSIVSHEISKTIDPAFQLRGAEYPLGGAYKIWGGPKSLGKNRPYVIVAFTPNGALDNVNKNFISQAILKTKGPVKMAQFAFSSETINEALLERAKTDLAQGRKFIFKSVGDTPFSMQEWSVFLKMSGLELIRDEKKEIPPKYIELKKSEWRKLLGEKQFLHLREQIRVAPGLFGTHHVTVNGEKHQVTSKIHHKLLLAGEEGQQTVVTGSFNFSKGAESNQEYVLIISDQKINKELDGAVDFLHEKSKASVFDEALRRNLSRSFDDAIPLNQVEKLKNLKLAIPGKCKNIEQTLRSLK
jgi:phosphatidylserine/phosphatidylglycerophosphate/cardiolipin synthase-like enzyme